MHRVDTKSHVLLRSIMQVWFFFFFAHPMAFDCMPCSISIMFQSTMRKYLMHNAFMSSYFRSDRVREERNRAEKSQLCDWSLAEIPFLHIWAFSYEELNRILLLAESRSFCRFEKHSHESIIRRLLILSHRWNFCLLDIPFFTLAFALEIDSSAIFECETHKNQLRQLFNGNYSNRARQFPTHTLGDGEWLSRHVNVFSFEPKKIGSMCPELLCKKAALE